MHKNRGLKLFLIISLFCHIFCFHSLELTFNQRSAVKDVSADSIFFLGPILQEVDDYAQSTPEAGYYTERADRLTLLNRNIFRKGNLLAGLRAESSPRREIISDLQKLSPLNLIDHKVAYFQDLPVAETNRQESSIMFYPSMPYHFLLYFKDRQTAHMEITFYISAEGKILGLKRKISSGNPEVDLLIMRNLTHFLNLFKTNLALDSWQTVKIDLSP